MVSSVQPTAHTPISPLQIQPRPAQAGETGSNARDSVSLSRAASAINPHAELNAARSLLDLALAAGREGASLISQMRDVARASIEASDAERAALNEQFQALKSQYSDTVDKAIKAGADLLAGSSIDVAVDSDGAPVTVAGYDLRVKDEPGVEDVLRLSTSSGVGDEASARAAARDADASLARIDVALSRLSGAAQKLAAHDGFLSALEGSVAANIKEPADAEGARLMALQVRQGLLGGNAAIANAAPQALLTLFRE